MFVFAQLERLEVQRLLALSPWRCDELSASDDVLVFVVHLEMECVDDS